ncbi:hypothetical protein N7527_001004 [Penicillium freii]|uniref:Uncharacterized protein n=1 Tax=Penicillium freii TaxID=48697 RepID=A0A117NR52_PENFR|nr:hypothetical protein N7527_001004 [Penicillium freii]KUM64998.1 hypothetical protein ACN42_g2079 [Penicillium freii]
MSGKMIPVLTQDAPAPMPILSQGIVYNGVVYVSGTLGIIPSTGKFVDGTVADRTVRNAHCALASSNSSCADDLIFDKDQIFRNISAILKAAGSSLDSLIKVNIFLTSMSEFSTMNEAYAKNIPSGVMPVRTCVAVKELPFGSDVEIECIAALE